MVKTLAGWDRDRAVRGLAEGRGAPVDEYAAGMPRWLLPWMFPLLVAVVAVLFAISATVAVIALVVILVVCIVTLVAMRRRTLRERPDSELVHKPFWEP